MVEITSSEGLEEWLRGQERPICAGFAARCALRVLPVLNKEVQDSRNKKSINLILPVFRATAVSWCVGTIPNQSAELGGDPTAYAYIAAAKIVDVATVYAETSDAAIIAATEAVDAASYVTYGNANAADAALFATDVAPAVWNEINSDVTFLDKGGDVEGLMQRPLWSKERPVELRTDWEEMKTALLGLKQNWQVWTNWYEDRLIGGPRPNGRLVIEALERERVLIPNEDWEKGAAHVNALIAQMEKRYQVPEPPKQRPAVIEVELRDDGKIHRKADEAETQDQEHEADLHEAWETHKGQFEDFTSLEPARNEPALRNILNRYEKALGAEFDQVKIIALGMQGLRLKEIAEKANERFLEGVESEIKALAAAHALFIMQFPKWRRHLERAEPDPTLEQLEAGLEFSREIKQFSDIIADDVLEPTADLVEDIEDELFNNPQDRPILSNQLLTADANILAGLMRPCMDYVRDLGQSARKGSLIGVEKGIAALIHRVIEIGGAVTVLTNLMPDKFGWVPMVVEALKKAILK